MDTFFAKPIKNLLIVQSSHPQYSIRNRHRKPPAVEVSYYIGETKVFGRVLAFYLIPALLLIALCFGTFVVIRVPCDPWAGVGGADLASSLSSPPFPLPSLAARKDRLGTAETTAQGTHETGGANNSTRLIHSTTILECVCVLRLRVFGLCSVFSVAALRP